MKHIYRCKYYWYMAFDVIHSLIFLYFTENNFLVWLKFVYIKGVEPICYLTNPWGMWHCLCCTSQSLRGLSLTEHPVVNLFPHGTALGSGVFLPWQWSQGLIWLMKCVVGCLFFYYAIHVISSQSGKNSSLGLFRRTQWYINHKDLEN